MHVGCFNNVLFACFDCFDFSFVYMLFGESFGCFAKVGLRLNEAAGETPCLVANCNQSHPMQTFEMY